MQSRVVYLVPVWMDVCARWIHPTIPFLGSFVCIRTSSKPPRIPWPGPEIARPRSTRVQKRLFLGKGGGARQKPNRHRAFERGTDPGCLVDARFYFHGLSVPSSLSSLSSLSRLSFMSSNIALRLGRLRPSHPLIGSIQPRVPSDIIPSLPRTGSPKEKGFSVAFPLVPWLLTA